MRSDWHIPQIPGRAGGIRLQPFLDAPMSIRLPFHCVRQVREHRLAVLAKGSRVKSIRMCNWGITFGIALATFGGNASAATVPVTSGLLYQLDAGAGVTMDGSNRVSAWADQGAAGNDFLQ